MKTLLIAFAFTFFLVAPQAEAGRAAAILKILWRASKESIDDAAKAADTRMVQAAIRRHGPAVTEETLQRGGYGLLRTARLHGDAVLETAIRVPGSERLLTTRPEFYLRAARRYGDDALRLEIAVPGFLEKAGGKLTTRQILSQTLTVL